MIYARPEGVLYFLMCSIDAISKVVGTMWIAL